MKKLDGKPMDDLMLTAATYLDAGIDFVPIVVTSAAQKTALNSIAGQSINNLQEICAKEYTGADDEVMFDLTVETGDDPVSMHNSEKEKSMQ